MKHYIRSFVILVLIQLINVSCTSIESIRASNREALVKLKRGMSKNEVMKTMPSGSQETFSEIINNPYRSETLKGKDGNIYDILFYYTDIKARDGAITDDELTPMVFKENKLIGWGWSFINDTIGKYEIRIR